MNLRIRDGRRNIIWYDLIGTEMFVDVDNDPRNHSVIKHKTLYKQKTQRQHNKKKFLCRQTSLEIENMCNLCWNECAFVSCIYYTVAFLSFIIQFLDVYEPNIVHTYAYIRFVQCIGVCSFQAQIKQTNTTFCLQHVCVMRSIFIIVVSVEIHWWNNVWQNNCSFVVIDVVAVNHLYVVFTLFYCIFLTFGFCFFPLH